MEGAEAANPSSPKHLDYSPAPRLRRRTVRWMFLTLALILLGLLWRYGSAIQAQAMIDYLQWQCLHYSPSPNQVVYDADPKAAQSFLQTPGYARISPQISTQAVVYQPSHLQDFASRTAINWSGSIASY